MRVVCQSCNFPVLLIFCGIVCRWPTTGYLQITSTHRIKHQSHNFSEEPIFQFFCGNEQTDGECIRFPALIGFPCGFTGTLPPAVPVLLHRPACRAALRVHYPYIPAPECSFLQNVDTCLLRSQQLCVRNRFYRNMFTAYSVRH